MKKRSFFAGMLTMALIVGLGFSALAATGQVSFNASALTLNGTQVSAKGENYTLANGQSVPASITYTDEKGGGTTYLPVRRISELLGVETGWDGATGSVTIGSAALPSQPPVTTTPPADYSDWSKEDEAAYQEFKRLWEVELISSSGTILFTSIDKSATMQWWDSADKELKESFIIRASKDEKAAHSKDVIGACLFRASGDGTSENLARVSLPFDDGVNFY